MLSKIKKALRINSIKRWFYTLFRFAFYAKCLKDPYIDDKSIILESQHGNEISGNMFYILQELSSNTAYKDFKLFVSYRKKSKKKIQTILNNYSIQNVTLARVYSFKYIHLIIFS